MTTLKDVAKLAGVSVSTASCALNGKKNVSEATRRKVLEAAKTLQYQKNGFAFQLKLGESKTIALIIDDLAGPYFSEFIKGVQDLSLENGYDLIACSSLGGVDSTALKFLTERRTDGVIVFAHHVQDEWLERTVQGHFPIVVVDRRLDHSSLICMDVDNEQGAYLAVKHLIDYGHERIGYVSGPVNSRNQWQRFSGYQRALREHGLSYQTKWTVNGHFRQDGGFWATKRLIDQGDLPSALFYANDEMALGGLRAFREHGIRVPGDISIVGFDDIELAQHVRPALTTIRQPKYEMGALAVDLLLQSLRGEATERYYTLSTELVVRQSTRKVK